MTSWSPIHEAVSGDDHVVHATRDVLENEDGVSSDDDGAVAARDDREEEHSRHAALAPREASAVRVPLEAPVMPRAGMNPGGKRDGPLGHRAGLLDVRGDARVRPLARGFEL